MKRLKMKCFPSTKKKKKCNIQWIYISLLIYSKYKSTSIAKNKKCIILLWPLKMASQVVKKILLEPCIDHCTDHNLSLKNASEIQGLCQNNRRLSVEKHQKKFGWRQTGWMTTETLKYRAWVVWMTWTVIFGPFGSFFDSINHLLSLYRQFFCCLISIRHFLE